MGRFITADPSGMSDGPNLYVYCKNDPVNAVDLWGLDTILVNYQLLDSNHKPTNEVLSHSYLATVEKGVVTNTLSWGLNSVGKWERNNTLDIMKAQEAINSGKGFVWIGNKTLDPYIISTYEIIKDTDISNYNLLLNNCKDHTKELIDAARKCCKN
ncbi:MAG: RHS repeat-associated core domain-containing protein [Candidatus Omnitrophota bacterium]